MDDVSVSLSLVLSIIISDRSFKIGGGENKEGSNRIIYNAYISCQFDICIIYTVQPYTASACRASLRACLASLLCCL